VLACLVAGWVMNYSSFSCGRPVAGGPKGAGWLVLPPLVKGT